jgi:hypothetical protein
MTVPATGPADGDVYPADPLSAGEQMSSVTNALRAQLARTVADADGPAEPRA